MQVLEAPKTLEEEITLGLQTFGVRSPILPTKKVTYAMPNLISIFCDDHRKAAELINTLVETAEEDYQMLQVAVFADSADFEYEIDGYFYLFRWRKPTVYWVWTLGGDIAYICREIYSQTAIDSIRKNHAKGVVFF